MAREAKTKMKVTTPMVDEEEAEGVAAIGQPVAEIGVTMSEKTQ